MIIIIGSGLAGYTLVREIRKLNTSVPVAVITQDLGHYYSKPQLSTALSHQKSADQLILIRAEKFAAQFNIQLFPQTFIQNLDDLSQIIPGYTEYPNIKIILAVGAKPIMLPSFKKSLAPIYHINNLEDYTNFRKILDWETSPKKITIIGAGLVGCEFANDFINTGYDINIVAPDTYPLAKLIPEAIGTELRHALAQKGVNWQLTQFFDAERLDANNIILSAIGLAPETKLAQQAGIKIQQGIVTNQYLQTNIPHIYALGDCAEINGKLMPYVAPLALGARALAKTLLGHPTSVSYPPLPIFIKTSHYPIVVLPPALFESGEWQIERDLTAVRALFYNPDKQLKGFALGGSFASESNNWISQIHHN